MHAVVWGVIKQTEGAIKNILMTVNNLKLPHISLPLSPETGCESLNIGDCRLFIHLNVLCGLIQDLVKMRYYRR